MGEKEEPPQAPPADTSESSNRMPNASLSIWPPSRRTRDAVIKRLVDTLSSESILSKRYGVLSHDEAVETANRIEEEAFSVVAKSASADDDGLETLQAYSKEISRGMLDAVKSRSASAADQAEKKAENDASTGAEEPSAVKTES